MKRHSMPDMKEGGVNVTPLIDIVMCLIIFFMLVAKIGVTSGADPNIKPPSTLLGAKIEDMGNTFTINVRDWAQVHKEAVEAANKTGVAPPPIPTPFELQHPRVRALVKDKASGKEVETELQIISTQGQRELRDVLAALVKNNPKLRVIILADKDIRYELLQQILIDCSMAKVKDFNFETAKGV
jgi:biopolymer transport protein ExbD